MDEEQREVALKRFQAEARIAAKIDHPNVIKILGFNRDTTEYQGKTVEIDYLVMELLAQRTLQDTMDESGFESELVSVKDPEKYYTDTSFRVARDVDMDKVSKKNR